MGNPRDRWLGVCRRFACSLRPHDPYEKKGRLQALSRKEDSLPMLRRYSHLLYLSQALRELPLVQQKEFSRHMTIILNERLQRTARSGYASAGNAPKKAASSYMPWFFGAVAVTIPSVYFLRQSRSPPHDEHHHEHTAMNTQTRSIKSPHKKRNKPKNKSRQSSIVVQSNRTAHNSKSKPQSTTTVSTGAYIYSPISNEEIRLLQISPTKDGPVAGTLHIFRLGDPTCPKYAALSYHWGKKEYSWSITVDGKDFNVLKSLELFIHMLLDQRSRWKNTWWWIDSICINTEDLQERGVQVQRMRQIYSRADRTIVWLGKESPGSDDAMDFLAFIDRERRQANVAVGKDERLLSEKMEKVLRRRTENFGSNWTGVNELFLRPWWTRVWTLQELVLSRRVTFYCGKKSLSRSDLKSAVYGLWLCRDDFPLSRPAFNAAWNRRRLLQWYGNGGSRDSNGSRERSLVAMMAYFSDNNATDPRDRIYSLLGLAADAEVIGRPNYNASTEDVYSELIKSFIKRHQSLDAICFAQLFHTSDTSSTSSLPSWVPDWRIKVDPTVIPLMVSQSAQNYIGNLRPLKALDHSAMYSASGSEKPRVRFEAPGSIVCEGIFLDFVDGLGGCIPKADICAPCCMVPSTSVINAPPGNQGDSRVGDAHLMMKICRCLVLDRKDTYLSQPSPTENYLKDFQLFCSTAMSRPSKVNSMFINWFLLNKSLKVQGLDIESLSKRAAESAESIPISRVSLFDLSDDESFLARFRDTTKTMNRRLLVSEKGMLGMAPIKAKKGDITCVLFGCSVPLLLRQRHSQEEYEFIGECYLDGYMNGEALGSIEAESRSLRTFRIF